jgi:hypothetical protein
VSDCKCLEEKSAASDIGVCVCVCVRERERERERQTDRQTHREIYFKQLGQRRPF